MGRILNPLPFLHAAMLLCLHASGQKERPDLKFGNVKVADFSPKIAATDSSADAVFLFDVGNAYFEGNKKDFFSTVYEKHTRVKLIRKTSFDDLATVKIEYFEDNGFKKQEITELEAATYNLQNGQITTTKVDKSTLFKEQNGKWVTAKFTFPNVKEGSIVEFRYKIESPYYWRLPSWKFQGEHPQLWSEYTVEVPELFDFVVLKQGYLQFTIDTVKNEYKSFVVINNPHDAFEASSSVTVNANVTQHTWAIKNVPAFKEEAYTSSYKNFVRAVEFQYLAYRPPHQPVEYETNTWQKASKELLYYENFGHPLTDLNIWLKDDIKSATNGLSDSLQMVKAIYEFVRDNYTCKDNTALYLSQPLKKTHFGRSGNVTDINMLLIAMMHNAGFAAEPMILSTRENGRANEAYPILSRYNYTIAHVKVGDSDLMLDASVNRLPFGKLPPECYNGKAVVVSQDKPLLVTLSADALTETTQTSAFISNMGDSLAGTYSSTLGFQRSLSTRQALKTGVGVDNFFKEVKKSYLLDVAISNTSIDSLNKPDYPVAINYYFDFKPTGDIIYYNPLMGDALKQNPFKSAERLYPVERPYSEDNTFVLNMEIPKGYKVDELPTSAKVLLNTDDGFFEYVIRADKERVQLRCRTLIKKATFLPQDYQTLRDFFAFIVKKEAEQIVFKKL